MPQETPLRPFTVNSAIKDVAECSRTVRLILWAFKKYAAKTYGRDTVNYKIMVRGAEESPLRIIQDLVKTKGNIALALADLANKKFFRGIGHLFR
jgi:hypothetical protein